MNFYPHLLFLIAFLLLGQGLEGQRRALGKPEVFERPYSEKNFDKKANTKNKRKTPWIVICDSEAAVTYDRLSDDQMLSVPKEQLKFRDWFYVSEETDCCIRIFKGSVNSSTLRIEGNTKDYGWIDKSNILLWTSSLIDASTRIDLKAFLLNKAADVNKVLELEDREMVEVYNSPQTGNIILSEQIYRFYFVLKKSGQKYLLSKNVSINPSHNPEDLVGWVRQQRLEEWNTRVCMEPNFEEAAFLERKINPNFQLVAYKDPVSAKKHSDLGKAIDNKAIWKSDPVRLAPKQLASNKRRFNGGVIRFPMLSRGKDITYFRTGMIGKIHTNSTTISENDWAAIKKLIARKEENLRDNYDVLFLIEGSKSMADYKQAIKKSIQTISQELSNVKNVRYSVAVYRDTPEKAQKKLFDIKKVNSSIDEITGFVSKIEFARWEDNDDYTAMYYGINQALMEANLNDQHTNITFVFGNNADLKSSQERKGADECFLETGVVASKLADFHTHIVAIQCQNLERPDAYFVKNTRNMMLEAANIQFEEYSNISKDISSIKLSNPDLTDDNQLMNGASIGLIISPTNGKSMSPDDITNYSQEATKKIHNFVENFWRGFNQIVDNGGSIENIGNTSSLGAQDFTPVAAQLLFNVNKEGRAKGITQDKLDKIIEEKYQLYTEVFIPKKIKGASYDTYSQVLLMPEKDLEDYVDVLNQLAIVVMGTPDEVRKGLYTSLINLVEQYTGHKMIRNYGTDDLRAVMQGVNKEGLKANKNRDFVISNVLSEKKISDKEVRRIANDMLSKTKDLKKILKMGSGYEFSYTSQNNTYFWIPIEYTF